LNLLAEQGYDGMSVETVAAAAGVTRPAIYRRWPTKADLATAALGRLQESEPALAAAGTRQKLVSYLKNFQTSLFRPNGMAMIGTLLVEERRTPGLLALFRRRIVRPRREGIRVLLEEGIRRGEIRADADLELVTNALVGSFYARYLAGGAVPRDWPRRAVEALWAGLSPDRRPGRK
jgi:AcrR family transcriptional regulator